MALLLGNSESSRCLVGEATHTGPPALPPSPCCIRRPWPTLDLENMSTLSPWAVVAALGNFPRARELRDFSQCCWEPSSGQTGSSGGMGEDIKLCLWLLGLIVCPACHRKPLWTLSPWAHGEWKLGLELDSRCGMRGSGTVGQRTCFSEPWLAQLSRVPRGQLENAIWPKAHAT